MTNKTKTIHDIEQGELLKILDNFKCDLLMLSRKYKEKNTLLEKQIQMCLSFERVMQNYVWGTTYINFTPKELEILELLLLSLTDDEIKSKLHIAKRTLNTHYQNIARKIYDNEINKFFTLEDCNYLKYPKKSIKKYLTNSIIQIMFRGVDTNSYIFEKLKDLISDNRLL